MRFAIDIPPFGPFAEVRLLADLAHEAEEAGWDGFFLWDHLVWDRFPIADTWVALTAIAMKTSTIRIGSMVTPLPRRRPTKVARESATLDQLSHGRLILGVGIGGGEAEWGNFGEQTDLKVRAAMLDESLDVLTGLWSGEPFSYHGAHYTVRGEGDRGTLTFQPTPVQRPHIPIWVAGVWPRKAPFRRAARWDGVVPLRTDTRFSDMMTPEQVAEIVAYIRQQRPSDAPFDVSHWGITAGDDRARDGAIVREYEAAGATWWRENLSPWRFGWDWKGELPVATMRERIRRGPPKE
ncbi:MAG: LLM class flavin-dependent oxidoreductase [Ktedonobacterales bacterium]